MPYNNTAIPPPEEVTGQASLPLARVKRIIHVDEEVNSCSNNAAFVITVAAEMFIRYLAEQGHNVVKSERKPRKNIQYKDIANAVARIDNLEFLTDVVPRTTSYKKYKEKKLRETTNADVTDFRPVDESDGEGGKGKASGQDYLAGEQTNGLHATDTDSVQKRVARLDMEIRGGPSNGTPGSSAGRSQMRVEHERDEAMDDSPL